ncbi:MAG: hypothetical protein WC788_05720 [Candidatus Paceibacterota bacterium]|jgi:hypothetical protein
MIKEDELKQELINFVKSIAREYPGIGKRMEASIRRIEKDVMGNFSRSVAFSVRTYIAGVLQAETQKQLMTGEELKIFAAITLELMNDREGSAGRIDPERLEGFSKHLEVEIRSRNLVASARDIAKELEELVGEDRSILDQDKARGIYSSFIELAQGKKPEEIEDFAANLSRAGIILKMFALQDRALKLEEERMAIVGSIRPEEVVYDPGRILLAKEILSLKIRSVDRSAASYKDVEEKKQAAIMLGKLKTFLQLKKKEVEWNILAGKLEEYFDISHEHDTDPFNLNRKRIIEETSIVH